MAQMQQGRVMRAAGFLMATQIIARGLGWVRDALLLNMFGQTRITDAYNVAFKIPDFLYNIIIGGAITAAFIPVFASYLAKQEKENAWQVYSIVVSWCMLLMGAGVLLAYVFTPQLIAFLATGFEPEAHLLTVTLTRVMLLQPVFMALAGVSMGVLNSHQQFTWPAVGSMLYNLFIVLCGFLLSRSIEARFPGFGVAGFSIGVLAGAIVYFLVQLPALRQVGLCFKLSFNIHHPGFVRLIHLLIPVLVGLSVQQINQLVNVMLGSSLPRGSIAALNMAQRFMNLPIYVFATSIAVAMFPSLTQQAALADMPEFKKSMSLGIRSVAFICIPAAVGLAVLREPIIRLMFEFKGGQYGAAATSIAGQALLFYCIGIAFYGIVHVLLRSFYSLQNTVTPVLVSVATIATNLLFSLLLIRSMYHMGLALAFSIAGIVQCCLLFLLLRRRLGHIDMRNMLASFLKTGAASLVMGVTAWGLASAIAAVMDVAASKMAQIIQLGVSMGLAVAVFFCLAYLLRMEEAKIVVDMFKRRLRRKKRHSIAGEEN